jgi:membrane dipeptidase
LDEEQETPLDDRQLALSLGCSLEAVQLARRSELIDLHIDTFIPPRLWGYDIFKRHRRALGGRHFFGHLDLPRMQEGGLSGAMWSITTNPLRPARDRWRTFERNLARLRELIYRSRGQLAEVRNVREYREARERGAHACMIAIQGGNALEAAPDGVASLPDDVITRVTLVHLTTSCYGATSTPAVTLRQHRGLTDAGRALVEQLDQRRVFVDLAHIHPDAFWDAVEVHDPALPLIDTHTGVDGVTPHWRNLTDAQLKAIAETGGVIGVIFSTHFLSRPGGPRDGAMIVDHMQHIIDVVGEDFVAVGSDYDGAINPPHDLWGGETYPRLVQHMLDRGWSPGRVQKVLGGNFLRAWERLRPGGEVSAPPV